MSIIEKIEKLIAKAFYCSLKKTQGLNIIFFAEEYDENMLQAITRSFRGHFSEYDLVALKIIFSSRTEYRGTKDDIIFEPQMFDGYDEKQYWQVLAGRIKDKVDLSFYDSKVITDHFKIPIGFSNKGSQSNIVPIQEQDEIFLEYIKAKKYKKIVDLGCGGGAFYPIMVENAEILSYRGYDWSRQQIDNAMNLYPQVDFIHKDISSLKASDFNDFDVIHILSVFAFMSKAKALKTIDSIMKSSAAGVFTISCTADTSQFASDLYLKIRTGDIFRGEQRVAVDYFPFVNDLIKLNSDNGNKYLFHASVVSDTVFLNWEKHFDYSELSKYHMTKLSFFLLRFANKFFSRKQDFVFLLMFPRCDKDLMSNILKKNFGKDLNLVKTDN